MDYAACHVIYVDKSARGDRLVKKDQTPSASWSVHSNASSYFDTVGEADEVQANVQTVLAIFNQGEQPPKAFLCREHRLPQPAVWRVSVLPSPSLDQPLTALFLVFICTSGTACSSKLAELGDSGIPDLTPILVLVNVSPDERFDSRVARISQDVLTPSPTTTRQDPIESYMADDAGGLRLLHNIALDIQNDVATKLIVPIAVLSLSDGRHRASTSSLKKDPTSGAWFVSSESTTSSGGDSPSGQQFPVEPGQMLRCLEAGATDVLTSPLQRDRVFGLTTHAYRARKEAAKERSTFLATKRMRKRSWVGVDDGKPYAYLRESMYVPKSPVRSRVTCMLST